MLLPIGANTFSDAMAMGCETYHHLKSVIKKKYGQDACNVGDEGGFAPNIQSNREGVELLMEAIEKAGYTKEIKLGMDVAASEFYTKDGRYDLDFKSENAGKKTLSRLQLDFFIVTHHVLLFKSISSSDELGDMYVKLVNDFPIVSIEDPFDQV